MPNRLMRLVGAALVSRRDDHSHKQKVTYSLTEVSIDLVPLLAHMGGWGLRHTPSSPSAPRQPVAMSGFNAEALGSFRSAGSETTGQQAFCPR